MFINYIETSFSNAMQGRKARSFLEWDFQKKVYNIQLKLSYFEIASVVQNFRVKCRMTTKTRL